MHGSTPSNRWSSLDGLRAFAILSVLVFHVGECWQGELAESAFGRLVYRLSDLGYLGVDLFFVLSGFLITGILLDSRRRRGYFSSFYARRTLRIFPLYYAFLAANVLICAAAGSRLPGAEPFLSELPWYALYLPNLKFARDGYPLLTHVHHLWSLAIEEQFYLLWPAVVAVIAPRKLRTSTLLLVITIWIGRAAWVARGATPVAVYVGTATRVDALLLGACLALARRESAIWSSAPRWAPRLALAGGAACLALLVRYHGLTAGAAPTQMFGFAAVGVLFTGVVAWCVSRQERGRTLSWLEHPALQRVGTVSYGMYLFHWPLALALHALAAHWLSGLPGFTVALLLCGLASYLLAELSFRWFEQPLLALKARFPRPELARQPVEARAREASPDAIRPESIQPAPLDALEPNTARRGL